MLSANTAWLVTNDKKPPLDDPEFRKAIAYAVNIPDIVNKVYGNIVKAADPTGLLPTWDKYIDTAQRDALGFKYDPAKSAAILDAAGYKKGSDGFYTNKDGSPIKLTIMVPSGWSDWEASRDVIVASLKAVGINAEAKVTDYNGLVADRNSRQLRPGPQQRSPAVQHALDVLRLHVPAAAQEGAARNRNFGQYENPEAWALVQQLDKTPVDDVAAMKAITSKLQKISLDRDAGHPAVVQRALVAGQQRRSGPTGRPKRRPHPARHLERVLADGCREDAHRDRAGPGGAVRAILLLGRPLSSPPTRRRAISHPSVRSVGSQEIRVRRYFGRKLSIYAADVLGRGHDRLDDPAVHARGPGPEPALALPGVARGARRPDRPTTTGCSGSTSRLPEQYVELLGRPGSWRPGPQRLPVAARRSPR